MKETVAVQHILRMIGENPEREGLLDTPARVVKSWNELYSGYKMDPKKILSRTFDRGTYDQMIVLSDIDFFSTCEHHMLPFFGVAHVAYIPGKRVVGLSKLARLVECFARRLQIQERMTEQIAVAINDHLKPRGVAVVVKGKHSCMISRGVNKNRGVMTTSSIRGLFKTDPKSRAEFMEHVK
jgi:GTP cyclohydrolase IA